MRCQLFASIKIGTFGLLLPIYFTVCHRMIPFFASRVVAGYRRDDAHVDPRGILGC